MGRAWLILVLIGIYNCDILAFDIFLVIGCFFKVVSYLVGCFVLLVCLTGLCCSFNWFCENQGVAGRSVFGSVFWQGSLGACCFVLDQHS